MSSHRTVRCRVVVVDTPIRAEHAAELPTAAGAALAADKRRFRPSELLPWADPYIAGLVRKLQGEVREELTAEPAKAVSCLGVPVADLEWPWDEAVAVGPADGDPPVSGGVLAAAGAGA